jgi:hypothetical protein
MCMPEFELENIINPIGKEHEPDACSKEKNFKNLIRIIVFNL